jgi:hypothetical protein
VDKRYPSSLSTSCCQFKIFKKITSSSVALQINAYEPQLSAKISQKIKNENVALFLLYLISKKRIAPFMPFLSRRSMNNRFHQPTFLRVKRVMINNCNAKKQILCLKLDSSLNFGPENKFSQVSNRN